MSAQRARSRGRAASLGTGKVRLAEKMAAAGIGEDAEAEF